MTLPTGVALASFDSNKLANLWDILSQFPTTFADGGKDIEEFARRLVAPDSVVFELDGGMVLLEKIVPGLKAEFHATFWDRKLSARKEVLRDLLIWCFLVFQLERIETRLVTYARAVRRFLTEKLGFTFEGRMRNAFMNQGELYDLEVYSILREEAIDGSRH